MILCFVFAAVLSLDAFTVGLAASLGGRNLPRLSRLIIAAVSVFYATLAMLAGDFFTNILSSALENAIGGIMLILTGIGILFKTLHGGDEVTDGRCICTPGEALMLGFALSVDMLGAGTGYAIGDGLPVYFPVAAGLSQLLMLHLGIFIGKIGKNILKDFSKSRKTAELLPPIFIIFIGVISFFR